VLFAEHAGHSRSPDFIELYLLNLDSEELFLTYLTKDTNLKGVAVAHDQFFSLVWMLEGTIL
jgi:hypothetical protein